MNKQLVITASILLSIGIMLGAVGAHIVKPKISQEYLFVFEKAVRYQMYAAFGMLILGLMADRFDFSLKLFTILSVAGILIFSGGLYLYACHEMIPAFKILARIVPIGGFSLIGSWLIFAIQIMRSKAS